MAVASRSVHPFRRRIRLVAALVIAATVAVACGGDGGGGGGDDGGDEDAGAATVPSTPQTTSAAARSTIPAAVPAPLFGSLGGFIAAFDAVGGSGALPDGAPFSVAEAAITTGPLPSGGDGFVSADAIPNGILGGTLDADGQVNAVFVFVDPLTASAAPAVLSLLGTTVATPAEFDQTAFAIEYRQLAIEAASRADDQFWSPSANGSGHSLVTSVVAGAAGSNNLIEVAIVPFTDEADAMAAVRPIRNEVIGLLAG